MAKHNDTARATAPDCAGAGLERRLKRWRWLRQRVDQYVGERSFTPPLVRGEIERHSGLLTDELRLTEDERRLSAVLLHDAVWQPVVATIPFNRRVLLLPQCLRNQRVCPADMDEFGLLCEECGRCCLGRLQHEAESMGYEVLIAEGTAPVTGLIRQGKLDAVIGVSCLSTLEESFPAVVADAVPALAVPLLNEGCESTSFDLSWLMDFLHLRSCERPYQRIRIDALKQEVQGWFSAEGLDTIPGPADNATAAIGMEWLVKSGKRWRPVLTAAVFDAIAGNGAHRDMTAVRRAALATECFHKASLIHDDIEDDDRTRYGQETLHCQYGLPMALNIGDFLIGEGYRMISECDVSPADRNRMLAAVADAHRNLCIGQGEELRWRNAPSLLSPDDICRIFSLKTAPAFEVALRLGAICAGVGENVGEVLERFSKHLGIAYQISDDLRDFQNDTRHQETVRPSLLLALLWEELSEDRRRDIQTALEANSPVLGLSETGSESPELERARDRARALLVHHREQALDALQPLPSMGLKSLLMRLVRKIVPDE